MKVEYSAAVVAALRSAPPEVRKAFFKQVEFLQHDLHHRSLRAKKYDEGSDVWQSRVNRNWRFYFEIKGDTYWILKLIPHPK